jgi:putative membrane protein
MLGIVLRLGVSALAVWLSTLIIPGIKVTAETTWGTVGTLVLIALIFGAVNAVLKPIIKVVGCAFYVVTLGLIALVVNGLLFLLVSLIAGWLDIPFHVSNFWPSAVLGALFVGVVSWILGLVVKDRGDKPKRLPPPPPPPPRSVPPRGPDPYPRSTGGR